MRTSCWNSLCSTMELWGDRYANTSVRFKGKLIKHLKQQFRIIIISGQFA